MLWKWTKPLWYNAQGRIEFARQVLERNQGRKFNDRIIVKVQFKACQSRLTCVRAHIPKDRLGTRG
jgi:hypothetical protein